MAFLEVMPIKDQYPIGYTNRLFVFPQCLLPLVKGHMSVLLENDRKLTVKLFSMLTQS